MTHLKIGDPAPDFTLKDQNGKAVTLSSLRGKKVLVSFHPLAWTPVCEIQMKTLDIKKAAFDEANTVPLGLSVDAPPSKKAWADYMKLEHTSILADFWPHGETAKKYGVFIEKAGISGRANFLVDEKGMIEFIRVYDMPEVPDVEEVLRTAKKG